MVEKKLNLANTAKTATSLGITALYGYRSFLKAKVLATDVAIKGLENVKKNQNRKNVYKPIEKEKEAMKSFASALAVLAVTGAAIGAAGYYLYKKEKELNEYEDLLFNDEYMHEYPVEEVKEEAPADQGTEENADQGAQEAQADLAPEEAEKIEKE